MPYIVEPLAPSAKVKSFKKAPSPIAGEAFAPHWAGDWDRRFFNFPGGSIVQFDLSRLTLSDFRTMRDHYQVNATLNVMTFMLHQMDWKIECTNSKIQKFVTDNIKMVWTPLIRAISQAFWSGYAPSILQWENEPGSSTIQLTKIKDIMPETAWVHWKMVEGYAPPNRVKPKIAVFDGMKIWGQDWPVPTENTFWYPLLMENGDYFGRKLLRPVFTSWYFSILIHLFSNRYFERFGEPVPIGRAPYDEDITVNSSTGTPQKINGAQLMVQTLQSLRNRSVVVLPNDRTILGNASHGTAAAYDYEIEYLESQMRGADFERYLMRLDEEISLGLFTPLLILRTADVGSYNLGSTHWNMYLNMLNAIAGDMKYYIDNFILSRMVDYNFGTNAPRAQIEFRKMGDDRKDIVLAMLQALIAKGAAKANMAELGDIAGLTLEEVKAVTNGPTDPNQPPGKQPPAKADTGGKGSSGGNTGSSGGSKKAANNSKKIIYDIADRVAAQAGKFVRESTDGADFSPSLGYARQFAEALASDGFENPGGVAEEVAEFTALFVSDFNKKHLSSPRLSEVIQSVMISKLEGVNA